MNKWIAYQAFSVILVVLFGFMFLTSGGSGESGNTAVGYLVWVGVGVGLFIWAMKRSKESKSVHNEKQPPEEN